MTVEQILMGIMGLAITYISWSLRSMIETMKKNDREHYEQHYQNKLAIKDLEIRILRERK